ncbi:MAG: DUF2238 domain-containing protein [Bacteroidetes bacterium HGW-Bacteroidetes-6]|jgi:putative membrane protein|nr:MAG: DUF2238 domain-containing protein [Bacteroidetes bacterium HGW-Bacteroidetes-6]
MNSAFREKRNKLILFSFFIAITIAFCIGSPYPELMLLHHSATILTAAFLVFVIIRNNLSNISFAFIIAFILLHVIGAKWTYLDVPYDQWWKWLTGNTLSSVFGWQRNQYDRLVHFGYGLLIWFPAREILHRWYGYKPRHAAYVAWEFIAMSSVVYEMFEWLLTIIAPADQADNYNGQQGDMWDAQKDMALAMLGGIIAWIALSIKTRFLRKLEK